MRRNSPNLPEVNASSMADIAFLLLTFFLVAASVVSQKTTLKNLPKPSLHTNYIMARNVYKIHLMPDYILINDAQKIPYTKFNIIENELQQFILNNADGSFKYYPGEKKENSSENPKRALIFLTTNKALLYEKYLRTYQKIQTVYSKIYTKIQSNNPTLNRQTIQQEIPQNIIEN